MENLKSFSSCVLSTKVGHNFGCHMTPAEFYVSSDTLVYLQVSTEYLSKSCRTVGWMPCPASKVKQSRSKYNGQATPARRVKMYYEYLMR